MELTADLLINALISGILLAGFYAAVSVGIGIAFGMLDVVNIAHPAFIVLGSYVAYFANQTLGADPIVTALVLSPAFFLLGVIIYRIYYYAFERRGQESLRSLAFFFGILFITEVALILAFGVDYRLVNTLYSSTTWRVGFVDFPLRLVVPFAGSLALTLGLHFYLSRTFFGRSVLAVAQDPQALQLMGVNPRRVKELAFALSIATAGFAGAFLIVIQPVQPSLGRVYIGLVFAITVLGGLGSIAGTMVGAAILGIAESFTATFFGPSWSPAVSFGLLLAALAFRPTGLLGR
jgi:branched-chain amino acid transport system permease protein